MSLDVTGDQITAVAEADAAYLLPEFRGDEDEEPKDLAWLRQQGPAGWAKIEQAAATYLKECLRLEADGEELLWTLEIPEFRKATPVFMTEGEPEQLPMVDVVLRANLPPDTRTLDAVWEEPFGVVLIATTRTGTGEAAETTPIVSGERATLAEREQSAAPAMQPSSPSSGGWIHLGFIHILPEGVDHILFVLGLFLLVPKWKPLLQQTIVFTLAHSLSLAAASLGWVSFPATPVEVMIAASIAWVGMENLWKKEVAKGRLVLVGIFGLIHGLGFAGVLAGLLPADQPEKLPAALFGFNLGVEIGQIAVLAIAFACFGWLDEKRFLPVKRSGSILIALAGLILIIERMGDIELVPFL